MFSKHAVSVVVAVLGLALLGAVGGWGAKPDDAPKDLESVRLFQNAEFEAMAPERVEAKLRDSRAALEFEELLDYAMSQMMQDRFREAAVLYEVAARQAKTDPERVMALMLQGQALLEVGFDSDMAESKRIFTQAGECFNKVSRLVPDGQEAAMMRIVAWACAGDQLELMAAEQDQRRMGLELEGQEVALGAIGAALVSPGAISFYKQAGKVIITFAVLNYDSIAYTIQIIRSDLSQEEKLKKLRNMAILSKIIQLRAVRVPNVLRR